MPSTQAQKFSDTESVCISRTIKAGLADGKDMDQAVAIAISECAPAKTTSKASVKHKMFGGQHVAEQNADGTWNVYDVPIMVEHSVVFRVDPRGGSKPVKFKVNKDWMLTAAAKQQKRMREDGYLPPLHVHHHKPGQIKAEDVEAAGKWRISAIRRAFYEGKKRWLTFADYLQVPEEKFAKMEKGQLDYRSVEIMDLENPEIDSLAILDHEVPFFRLSTMTFSKKIKHPALGEVREAAAEDSPCLMYRAVGKGVRVLFAFKEAIMPETQEENILKTKAQEDDEKKKKAAEDAAGHTDDDEKEKKAEEDAQEELTPVQRLMKAMEAMNAAVAEMAKDEEDKDEAPAPVEVESGAQDNSGDIVRTYKAPASETGVQYAEQIGKITGELNTLKRERATDKLVLKAVKDLEPYGYEPEPTAKELYALATKDGLKAMTSYVKGVMTGGKKDPDPNGDLKGLPAEASAELQPYANIGPKVYEAAVRYGAEFDEMKDRMRLTVSRKAYVDEQIISEGLTVPAAKEDK